MVSDLWEPIRDYIGNIDNGSMPAVHHYTTLKGAREILRSGRMWFTERSHLNDPSELFHGIKIAGSVFRKRGRTQDADHLDASAKEVFRNFRFFSASFSFKCDDASQWKKYADDGKGVALSFRASAFNDPKAQVDKFIVDGPTAFVCPMSYDAARLESIIGCIIDKWNGSNILELCDHLFMISSMFKSNLWESETEYRFFVHHPYEKILKSDYYKTREKNGQVIAYLEMPIKNWGSAEDFPIYRIRLGPATPDGLEAQLREFIFQCVPPFKEKKFRGPAPLIDRCGGYE